MAEWFIYLKFEDNIMAVGYWFYLWDSFRQIDEYLFFSLQAFVVKLLLKGWNDFNDFLCVWASHEWDLDDEAAIGQATLDTSVGDNPKIHLTFVIFGKFAKSAG